MQRKSQDAADFLKVLASASRLLVLCQLLEGEKSVGELARATGQRMTTVSQQLSVLRAHALVTSRREGTTIHYSLAHPAVHQVLDVLYRQFCQDE